MDSLYCIIFSPSEQTLRVNCCMYGTFAVQKFSAQETYKVEKSHRFLITLDIASLTFNLIICFQIIKSLFKKLKSVLLLDSNFNFLPRVMVQL